MSETAQIYTSGQEYWTIMKRVRENGSGPMIRKVAVKDLWELLSRTRQPGVRRRIQGFINQVNHKDSPGNDTGGSGPRVA